MSHFNTFCNKGNIKRRSLYGEVAAWYALPTVTPSHSLPLSCFYCFFPLSLDSWLVHLVFGSFCFGSVLFATLNGSSTSMTANKHTHTHRETYMHTLQYEAFISQTHTRSMHLLNTHITSHSRALCFLIIIIIGRRQSSMWFCGYGRLHLATHRRGLPEVGGVSGSAQSSIQFGGHSLHLLIAAKCICSCIYVSVDVSMYLYLQPSMTTKRNRN